MQYCLWDLEGCTQCWVNTKLRTTKLQAKLIFASKTVYSITLSIKKHFIWKGCKLWKHGTGSSHLFSWSKIVRHYSPPINQAFYPITPKPKQTCAQWANWTISRPNLPLLKSQKESLHLNLLKPIPLQSIKYPSRSNQETTTPHRCIQIRDPYPSNEIHCPRGDHVTNQESRDRR